MSNELGLFKNNQIVLASDDDFDVAATTASYPPRLQLMTASSKVCKSGEFPTNHYARVMDNDYRDLGASVDVLICSWRPFALSIDGNDIVVCYDMKKVDGQATGLYAEIMTRAQIDSQSGCMYGPQFLVWCAGEFMTYFMGSATARRASRSVRQLMHKKATFGSRKIEGKKGVWYGPTAQPCTAEIILPTEEQLKQAITAFNNPPKDDKELVEEGGSGRNR